MWVCYDSRGSRRSSARAQLCRSSRNAGASSAVASAAAPAGAASWAARAICPRLRLPPGSAAPCVNGETKSSQTMRILSVPVSYCTSAGEHKNGTEGLATKHLLGALRAPYSLAGLPVRSSPAFESTRSGPSCGYGACPPSIASMSAFDVRTLERVV